MIFIQTLFSLIRRKNIESKKIRKIVRQEDEEDYKKKIVRPLLGKFLIGRMTNKQYSSNLSLQAHHIVW